MKRDDEAQQTYGALKEGVHVGSYTFERAFRALAWLIEGDRWKYVGDGFSKINDFIDSLDFERYRIVAEQRKTIAQRIKELQPKASNRKMAKMVGVHHTTIGRDIGANAPPASKKGSKNSRPKGRGGANAPSGTKAAKIVERRTTDIAATQARRAEKERQLGQKIAALPDMKFGVIVADPEWHDEVYSEETGMNRHASRHYTTSDIETIKARPVASIAADDCVLFLWSTNQHLDVAIDVLRAWGFEYASHYIWRKPTIGRGYWNRSVHEVLLIGTRGDVPCPALGTQWESVIDADRGEEHSAKPEVFLEMIEAYFPTLPKIELNRRGAPRSGWSAWGNEVKEVKEAAE
jgi:N6-adenosine-specific RNA methylase IME4